MKNIFLDLGTHFGQGLNQFIHRYGMDETWEIYTFEANPSTYEIFTNTFHKNTPWVKSYNKAISDHCGIVNVNIETPPDEGDTGMGSSIIDIEEWNPWDGKIRENFKKNVLVPCIDLSDFIISNFDKNDRIIIKMDIEGSEYHTLEKMIETGAIDYVDNISIEWHSRFFVEGTRESILEREKNIKDYMHKNNIKSEDWY